ncbi:ABC transporter permease [Flavitalea sp.]|nr:ABC transporter permease [Flavitalea sp.]
MLKNYYKIVLRNLWRYKSYTLINIVGMAIGIAAMVWGYQTYRYSFSYDNFHPDRDNVYRALTRKEGADGIKGIFPMAAIQAAKNDFAGIQQVLRYDSRGLNAKSDTGEVFTEQVHFTDASFFDFFNFPIVSGVKDLKNKGGILITETIARKYFGNQNPVGKIITLYEGEPFALPVTVTGVLKDIPFNSTIQFGMLTNFENQFKPDGKKIDQDDWGWFVDAAYFKIPNSADAQSLPERLKKYKSIQNKAREDWKVSGFELMSLRDGAVQSNLISNNSLVQRPEDSAAYGPFVFAFLILLSACLNFSNTTIARANSRLKEIGMRKVMGSTFRQLVMQMLLECSVIVFAAICLSVLINSWWLPFFNQMFSFVKVEANYLRDGNLLIYLLVILILATLMAGAYPAFYISRFNPSSIFRGSVKFGGSNLFSRLMLGLQISISILTVIAGVAFARNAEFQRNFDFGYSLDNTLGILVPDHNTFTVLNNEIKNIPEITGVAGTRNHIGFSYRSIVAEAEAQKKETNYFEVGPDYLRLMQLQMAAGRTFDVQMESDYTKAILITEKTAAIFGWKDQEALGKQLQLDTATYSVVGILKDFHAEDFFEPLEPGIMKLVKEDKFQYLILQGDPKNLATIHDGAKKLWQKLFPLKPFNSFYQNEITAEAHKVNASIATIFAWFAVISVLLTATGLLALVSLRTLKKMKEIALRKLVGASAMNILVLINKSYVGIFFIAALIGCYGGMALTKTLMDMIFKVNVGVDSLTMIFAVVLLFVITACITGFKVWQAVTTKLASSLRT